ncbi:hypothetical protein K402DRAFT_422452 [Aulographum hederae CBS 113979]|uniref:Uncharacterized protein n=1 Tax=Aulographum hederae CBS 113979 TaxID=1176131 RepID=A0A6G1GVJ3_9PEZI|nr:hypothetical protein K402DRAFT_422452 [Aulographum hederae CBS 113979]
MASIYQRAKGVLIWLGSHVPQNQLHRQPFAPFQLDAVLQLKHEPKDDGDDPEKRARKLREHFEGSVRDMKAAWLAADHFIHTIVHEEYWKRARVIQEVVMAPETVTVCYGHDSVPWNDFITWVQRYKDQHPHDAAVDIIFELNDLRQRRQRPGEVLTLVKLLDTFKDSFSFHAAPRIKYTLS